MAANVQSSFGPLASYAGWMFLPSMVSGFIQNTWYRLTIRAGDPRPQPGSPRYSRDSKRVYTLVIASYLLYTIYEVWLRIAEAPNFYRILGLTEGAPEKVIKKQFKALTLKYHPDKIGPGSEHIFMMLKTASDVLADPIKRFAYERFGPTVVEPEWRFCHTYTDYMYRGLMKMWPSYVGSLIFLLVLSGLGKMEFGKYWRYLTLISLFFFELAVITRPDYLKVTYVVYIFTARVLLPFEIVQLAHQVVLSFFIALSQLGPLYLPPKPSSDSENKYKQQLEKLEQNVAEVQTEAKRWLSLEVAPFKDEEGEISGPMRTKFRDWLVERRLTSAPEVRDAMGRVIERRKASGPTLGKK